MDDDKPIDEDGVLWYGTREELEAWKAHKKAMAIRFVERGYSVAWTNDGDGYLEIYVPERQFAGFPELRASVKFFGKPSQYGIDQGRVSKLTMPESGARQAYQTELTPYFPKWLGSSVSRDASSLEPLTCI